MNDAPLVRRLEALHDLRDDRQRLIDRQRPGPQALRERDPFDELHHQKVDAVLLLEAVDARDVRMVERGRDACLAPEAREPFRVSLHRVGQHLDRHVPSQSGIVRAVDFAHPSDPETRHDLVGTEPLEHRSLAIVQAELEEAGWTWPARAGRPLVTAGLAAFRHQARIKPMR